MPAPLHLILCRVYLQLVRDYHIILVRYTSSDSTGTLDGTIRIFGAPGVETSLTLPSHTPIKLLQFATNVLKLVCIGEYHNARVSVNGPYP
jgi:hypothetical protein